MTDSIAYLISSNQVPSNNEAFGIAQRLNSKANTVLYELDEYEAVSIAFLLLDIEHLTKDGYKYFQFIQDGRAKEALDRIVSIVQHSKEGHLISVIEGLHIIGRYDLLEDHLGLSIDDTFRVVFGGNISIDRKALYCVFAGMPQEEADRILRDRLENWFCPESGRPLEETFVRNLRMDNYQQLITELYNALMEEKKKALATYIRPFAQIAPPPPPPHVTSETAQSHSILYPLPTDYPHGLCVIINVKSFMKPKDASDTISLTERHGSDIDKHRLSGTFKLFGFSVMTLDNPDYEAIHHYFKGLRMSPGLERVPCLVVCVMTHGDSNDNIYLHDRECISVTDLRKLCFNQVFVNKPRLYFIQACRGETALCPIFLKFDDCSVTNMESDCLISSSTVKGHSAVRSQTEGSWYITDLCQALQDIGHIHPIKSVLYRTRETLMARVESMNKLYVTQLSEDMDTLVRDVQLVRADEEHFLEGIIELAEIEIFQKLLDDQFEEVLNMAERQGILSNIAEKFADISLA
ncbi:hypothetical protein SK128_025665 [Halocaridina rubra]|uniref:Caspase-8 n=1 Tax=Halocaridina rubra TaxID=373956 RepID=A0AAN8X313_HALRR